jgi:hypothetical protein
MCDGQFRWVAQSFDLWTIADGHFSNFFVFEHDQTIDFHGGRTVFDGLLPPTWTFPRDKRNVGHCTTLAERARGVVVFEQRQDEQNRCV